MMGQRTPREVVPIFLSIIDLISLTAIAVGRILGIG
jgi:hypothetical protein